MPRGVLSSFKSNIGNPLKAYLFDVVVPNPIGGGDADALRFRVQATSIPDKSVENIHIDYQGTAGSNYPGRERYTQEWNATFAEGQDLKVYAAAAQWFNEMKTGDDISNKTDLYLTLIGSNDANALRVKLIGVYLQKRGAVTLDVKSSNAVTFDLTFMFDEIQDLTVGQGGGLMNMVKSLARAVINAI